jgi:acetyltransferase-like isoleucine patch superfamily enzyme
MIRNILLLVSAVLPWPVRRWLLQRCAGFSIHPTARIGLAWIAPDRLIMEEYTSIGHLTVCKNLESVHLKAHSLIGRGNWITGFPAGNAGSFTHQKDRHPWLVLGEHAAITHRHLIDCTSSVTVGPFTTLAGYGSQVLTHSIDLRESRQHSAPISIGAYCFIGTNCVLLGGCALPDYSVLGAKSLLNKAHTETHRLYGGVPATAIEVLPPDLAYFRREDGFVR